MKKRSILMVGLVLFIAGLSYGSDSFDLNTQIDYSTTPLSQTVSVVTIVIPSEVNVISNLTLPQVENLVNSKFIESYDTSQEVIPRCRTGFVNSNSSQNNMKQ